MTIQTPWLYVTAAVLFVLGAVIRCLADRRRRAAREMARQLAALKRKSFLTDSVLDYIFSPDNEQATVPLCLPLIDPEVYRSREVKDPEELDLSPIHQEGSKSNRHFTSSVSRSYSQAGWPSLCGSDLRQPSTADNSPPLWPLGLKPGLVVSGTSLLGRKHLF